MNTPIGAIPGALPPMIGWAAATGELGAGAWVLFAILFLWQHPHFYAIAWMFREDYARGGFKMLPVVKPDGKDTFRQSLAACIILIPTSLWPTFVGMTGWLYFAGASLCGAWFLSACVRWRLSESTEDARKVLRVSVIYLPLLLLLILVDSFFFHR
jgi:protoheme IX farnesyltransferase